VLFEGEQPQALLPIMVLGRHGVARGHLIGTEISNCDWVPMRSGFALCPELVERMLEAIRQAIGGLDLMSFYNLPARWQGLDNPLLGPQCDPSPNNIYLAEIAASDEPFIDVHLSGKKRANIKRGARRLEETFGPVRLVHVTDGPELRKVHAIFLAQRGERFEQMGICNIFAEPHFQRFFSELALLGFGEQRPALVFHALYAGDEVVATSCGTFSGTHFSQYINSTASGPAAKFSLMGILVAELLDELTRAGITSFDMGIGDFDYKTDWTHAHGLWNRQIPVTAKGRVAAQVLRARQGLKRIIKQNPAFWAFARKVRLTLFRLRTGKSA